MKQTVLKERARKMKQQGTLLEDEQVSFFHFHFFFPFLLFSLNCWICAYARLLCLV
jgi:hypothetical protein